MPITYNTENVSFPEIDRVAVSRWIEQVAAKYGKKCGEIGCMFCDDARIIEPSCNTIIIPI